MIAIANVFVQSNINAFGKMAMAGCGSYSKIEGFAFFAGNLFYDGSDNLCQSESGCKTV